MSSLPLDTCWFHVKQSSFSCPPSQKFEPKFPPNVLSQLLQNRKVYTRQTSVYLLGCKVALGDEARSLKRKAMEEDRGGLRKELSVEDALREQMRASEFDDHGGSGNVRGGGGRGSSGDSEDGNFFESLNEFKEQALAVFFFIFLYIYSMRWPEMNLIARDFVRHLTGGRESVRLKKAKEASRRLWRMITLQYRNDRRSLVDELRRTPTVWFDPRK